MAKQIVSGVLVLVLFALLTLGATLYTETRANTDFREKSESKIDEIHQHVIQIKTVQDMLVKKYDNDINK